LRDPGRIYAVMEDLRELWLRNPDLRLGQLLINAFQDKDRLYNIEDEPLIDVLHELYD